jgi:Zinc finger, C3HC4 type (RING finger)
MDQLRTLNKINLKNMALEKGLSRKGFNGRNISRMRKQDFIDFIQDFDSQTPEDDETSRSPISHRGVETSSIRRSSVLISDYNESDFEEEMLDFFGEIMMNSFQPIIHVLGLNGVENIRLFSRNAASSDVKDAKEQERTPKEEDECVPCLTLYNDKHEKVCKDDNCKCETCQIEKENAKIKSNIQEMENRITCIICQSNERKVLFSPCNHLATCIACSKNALLKNCPICRKQFDKLTRVFY